MHLIFLLAQSRSVAVCRSRNYGGRGPSYVRSHDLKSRRHVAEHCSRTHTFAHPVVNIIIPPTFSPSLLRAL
ncbi:hypothetical protein B0H34DRAFT_140484 [Crassisporium funariophilum]|nr:hypothetical protein B0H34DRAFT_140484 [Crassisporium funariophilum]